MDEATLIETIQSHLNTNFTEPVRTGAQEDDRPVPAIILDDHFVEELNFHNSPFANEAIGDFDGDGTDEYERYLNFDWRARFEYLVVDDDEVAATQLKDSVVRTFRLLSDDATTLHGDLKKVRVRNHGSPQHQFTEPKETELNVSVVFRGDHTMVLTPSDLGDSLLQTVQQTFTLNE